MIAADEPGEVVGLAAPGVDRLIGQPREGQDTAQRRGHQIARLPVAPRARSARKASAIPGRGAGWPGSRSAWSRPRPAIAPGGSVSTMRSACSREPAIGRSGRLRCRGRCASRSLPPSYHQSRSPPRAAASADRIGGPEPPPDRRPRSPRPRHSSLVAKRPRVVGEVDHPETLERATRHGSPLPETIQLLASSEQYRLGPRTMG